MPNDSTTIPPTSHSLAPSFKQLSRVPLVPEAVLKRHHAYCALDPRYRAAQRLQQALWLKNQGIPTAADDRRATDARSFLGSMLSADAASAGKNFLSADLHRLAIEACLMCEEDALLAPDRLFGHALSSSPLTFNLFGPLAVNLGLARKVFRVLLAGIIDDVQGVIFEHSPGRRSNLSNLPGRDIWLSDRTAADVAVQATSLNGEPVTIFIEVKLSESMGPAARMRERYNEVSRQVLLYRDPNSAVLRSDAVEQLWRLHLLSQLAVDNGVTPRAVFLAVAPQLNTQVWGAFRVYQDELIEPKERGTDRVPFVPLTLETVIDTIAAVGASDLAQALWNRYCDFTEVYRLSMEELTGDKIDAESARAGRAVRATLRPTRRAVSSAARHRTRTAATSSRRSSPAASAEVV
ncbi:PGN_0703 family putative restriction endonuclease [Bradyrhizobium diazoefficiens]